MTEPIHIVSAHAKALHRLEVAECKFVPEVGIVRVTGPNASGKSTVLRIVKYGLGGAGEVLPDAINDTSVDGVATLKVGLSNGYTIRRRITEANPKGALVVEGPDGGRHKQGKINEWLGDLSFDPLAFFGLKPERQREVLLSLGTTEGLSEQLDELDALRQRTYDARTPAIADKRAALRVPEPTGERPTPVDTAAEMARMGELQAEQRRLGDKRQALKSEEEEIASRRGRLDAARGEIETCREQIKELQERIRNGEAWATAEAEALSQSAAKADAERGALAAFPDPQVEMDEIQDRIAEADHVRASLKPWEDYEAAQQRLEEASQTEDELTLELNKIRVRKERLLQEAGIPIEGLSFGEDGEALLNGHPLSVASGREKIEMAVQVAIAANPDLRVCLIDEGNDVDLDGLKRLDELAKAHKFQIWMARIDLEAPGEIVVLDGIALDAQTAAEYEERVEASA